MSTLAWILVAALVAALIVCIALMLSLRRWKARAVRTEQLVTEARRAVRATAEEESAAQTEQLRVSIARAQADSLSAYVAEERRLSDQRRGELSVRERELSERMAELVASVEQRVEERLRAWESDLERAQNALQGAVSTLEQRMRQRIADVESKVAAETDELDTTIDEQRVAAVRLREELESSARDALAHALDELQMQADDRRRTIDELNERLRQHEHAVTEQVDRAESEARTRIELAFAELERRQVEHLERAVAREIDARSEAGAVEFENRMRAIREEAADRLREELDRTSESFLRRADGLIAAELQQAVNAASQRLDERIVALTRQIRGHEPPCRCGENRLIGWEGTERRNANPRRMAETTQAPLWHENEPAKVESWRLHILLEAGYPVHLAERIAASEVDLHDAVQLLTRGCDAVTATEILL